MGRDSLTGLPQLQQQGTDPNLPPSTLILGWRRRSVRSFGSSLQSHKDTPYDTPRLEPFFALRASIIKLLKLSPNKIPDG